MTRKMLSARRVVAVLDGQTGQGHRGPALLDGVFGDRGRYRTLLRTYLGTWDAVDTFFSVEQQEAARVARAEAEGGRPRRARAGESWEYWFYLAQNRSAWREFVKSIDRRTR